MAEILFYHLEHQPLERVLPNLLEKTLERGWRAVVQVGSDERLEALDTHLWTYRDESFLPHGTTRDGAVERQPIFLTATDENPNQANVLFLVEGAASAEHDTYERVVYLFDGRVEEAVQAARGAWKTARDGGHDVTYWQQGEGGKWERKA